MQQAFDNFTKLFKLKIKFAAISLVATVFYFLFYSLFVLIILPADGTPATATEIIIVTAAGDFIGILINFFMQKRFVFDLQRTLTAAFFMALAASLLGMALRTGIVAWLVNYEFFMQTNWHKLLPQIVAIIVSFFYNFYVKRFIFEKRWFSTE